MAKPPTFTTDAFAAIHLSASALFRVGAIDKATIGEFAATCLAAPAPFTAADQTAREANNVSQPVFARYLNTSESTVEKWETGAKRPNGMALNTSGHKW